MGNYYVYILANRSKTLYVGFTGNLRQRVEEHKSGQRGGFTKRYGVNRLVYFERHDDPRAGLKREKKLKNLGRATKIRIVERSNPDWGEIDIGGLGS